MEAQTVKQWLERVTAWVTDSVAVSEGHLSHDNSINLDELRAFLWELHKQLSKCGRPKDTLTSLPKVGQLLGKLNCKKVLKIKDADYQLILQCVLALHTNQPTTPLEEKATAWVQSQVRQSVSYYKEANPCSGVGESISCSASQYNHTASLKLLESMVEDLDKVPTTRWSYFTNCLVPGTQLSSTTLRDLSELCLPLVTSGNAVAPLVGSLLSCHGSDGKDGISPYFLQVVTATQDSAYSRQHCSLDLSYKGRVSLWTRHLPALESEFLHLCEALVPVLESSPQEARQLICSRQLPKACAENPSLLTAVVSLMESLFHHTDGSTFALSLMHLFDQCVEECRQSASVPYHCSHRWPGMQSLHAHLLADPRELSLDLLTLHIQSINNCLTEAPASDPARLFHAWLLLMQSEVWYPVVIRMLVFGSADNRAACLNILAWYNIPLVPDRHKHYKAQLGDVVTSLRRLHNKSSLQAQDLHYTFNQLHDQGLQDSNIHNVLRPLLMLFTVHGIEALQILQDIVKMDSGREQANATVTFVFLLNSVEFSLTRDIPRPFKEKTQQIIGDQGELIASTLYLCKAAYEDYQQEQAAGTVIPVSHGLLERSDRLQSLLLRL